MSGRTWEFSNPEEKGEKTNKFDKVSLFSGGMDSLISTINLMEKKKNTLLISHAYEGLTKNAQENIVKNLIRCILMFCICGLICGWHSHRIIFQKEAMTTIQEADHFFLLDMEFLQCLVWIMSVSYWFRKMV